MNLRSWVPMQAIFVLIGVLASWGAVGTVVVAPIVVICWGGALVGAVLLALYHLRRRSDDGVPRRRRGTDRETMIWAVCALVLVPAVVLVIDGSEAYAGLLFPEDVAAVWAFGGVAACCVAIYVSSLADQFYVLPAICGMFTGRPAWVTSGGQSGQQRRTTATLWVVHRGLAEIIGSVGVAFAIAVVVVAVGGLASSDETLSMAIESLGGTAVAVALLGLFGPRVRDAIRYMLAPSAGIGEWAEVRGAGGDVVSRGLVIDVSIDPGVKLHDETGSQFFVALRDCRLVQASPGSRPLSCNEAWAYKQFESVREACRLDEDVAPPERDGDASEPVPEGAVA